MLNKNNVMVCSRVIYLNKYKLDIGKSVLDLNG